MKTKFHHASVILAIGMAVSHTIAQDAPPARQGSVAKKVAAVDLGQVPGQFVPPLHGQVVRALPGQLAPLLPGQMVRALSGQVVRSLPGQMVQSLPGELDQKLAPNQAR